jgi:tRNA nucleotidyltransferase (CCA-adding enzyme)
MHIIMTHEQADFDAIASLLATAILQEDAYALIPRKLNRNVNYFIELYGGELPFYEFNQLPSKNIEKITLVDTQSLVTIKGINKNTKIHVVDHHRKREDCSEKWTYSFEDLGACTTILVEELKNNHNVLSMLQATLLLIGIYEDTGSLSYANTTSRDLQAAAYLLEQHASLSIANQYLNPPLSENQQKIYDNLIRNVQQHQIHENRIITAKADLRTTNEEISSIAHKVRDLLDPDALFLMVKTTEGIRLVARSSSNLINVGAIAQKFGGGGHPRAAAALVQTENDIPTLDTVYTQLLAYLPALIEPAIKVSQIMSKDPMLITPLTSAIDAVHLMQRYGYEGYPVVSDGKIVGLLNRRSVDRAITHKINLPAASLMEAGEVFVYTNDSLENVQQKMTLSGWGQIPVLEPDSKAITGIVTRTDLLKALGKPAIEIIGIKNLTDLLNKSIPQSRLAFLQLVADHAKKLKMAIYIVGGFVRDLILEHPSLDIDIVVEGDAIQLAKTLKEIYGGKISTHKRFGTAKWIIKEIQVDLLDKIPIINNPDINDLPTNLDLISARTEFYDRPTALPEVERSSIKLDLHRRDFSINTLALRLDGRHYGELYDYWGGLKDLNDGVIRVLHSLSFVDDPTRLIRAVRFEQRFNFTIEPRTYQLMQEALDLIKQVSGDRLRHELNLILLEDNPAPALLRLQELDLLKNIHPDLKINEELASQIVKILRTPIDDFWKIPGTNGISTYSLLMAYITWIGFGSQKIKSVCKRLRTPAIILESSMKISQAKPILHSLLNKNISEITAFFDLLPNHVLFIFYNTISDIQIRELIIQYITHWKLVKPFTNGIDLQSRGIKPGPIYKSILEKLRNAWLDGNINRVEEEVLLLELLIDQNPEI